MDSFRAPDPLLELSVDTSGDPASSAAIDGAGPWRRLIAIELPWMRPTILLVTFIRFIDSFRVFDNVYTLAAPAPAATQQQ